MDSHQLHSLSLTSWRPKREDTHVKSAVQRDRHSRAMMSKCNPKLTAPVLLLSLLCFGMVSAAPPSSSSSSEQMSMRMHLSRPRHLPQRWRHRLQQVEDQKQLQGLQKRKEQEQRQHRKQISKRDFASLNCRGRYDFRILVLLERVCEDCYHLYKDPEVHGFCR